MLNVNNNAAQIKREILVRIARLQLENKLEDGVHYIPREMAPRGSEPLGCCIFHDREILRQRVMARLGCSVEEYDDEKKLSEYAKEALEREKPTEPFLTVLHDACNACVKTQFMVTNACQACYARPCMMNCGRKAITVQNGRARIDSEKCVNCGLCMQNCPYHAIIRIPVPCEEACPVGAISKDENGKETIDYHKCIFCGKCLNSCPFGAIFEISQIFDILQSIKQGKKVVAMVAPAILSQYKVPAEQVYSAIRQIGFTDVIEVAQGAVITTEKESEELKEKLDEGQPFMTTSCCPAYIEMAEKHAPELKKYISSTRSPMYYTAQIAREKYPDAKIVFVGPCIAKRKEARKDDLVDYVMTFEEMQSVFEGMNISMDNEHVYQLPTTIGTAYGFAQNGGVTAAVLKHVNGGFDFSSLQLSPLDKKNVNLLRAYGKTGKSPAQFIEVMACDGGCISGPSIHTPYETGRKTFSDELAKR